MVTLRERLQTPLPACHATGQASSFHKSNRQRNPSAVVDWPGFLDSIRQFPLNDDQICPEFHPIPVDHIAPEDCLPVPSESTFMYLFMRNVLESVVGCFPPDQLYHCGLHPEGKFNPADLWIGTRRQALIGEGKPRSNAWARINSLVQVWSRNEENPNRASTWFVSRTIRQLYGYMVDMGLRFGFITTYNSTWFVQRNPANFSELWISPRIAITDVDPSVAQCVYYLLHQPCHAQTEPNDEDEYFDTDFSVSAEESQDAALDSNHSEYHHRGRLPAASGSTLALTLRSNKRPLEETPEPLQNLICIDEKQAESSSLIHGTLTGGRKCTLWFPQDTENTAEIFSRMVNLEPLHKIVFPRPLLFGLWNGKPAIVLSGHWDHYPNLKALTSKEKVTILDVYNHAKKSKILFGDVQRDDVVVECGGANDQTPLFLPQTFKATFNKKQSDAQADKIRELLFGK